MFELKWLSVQNMDIDINPDIDIDIDIPYGNIKPKIYIRYTKKQGERNWNITLKKSIKPQGKRSKEAEKNKEELEKQPVNK